MTSGIDDQGGASVSGTERALRVIAITSGKGGVGKSNITVNLALSYARAGRNVLVIDGDVGLANVDILMDETPRYTMADLMNGSQPLEEVLVRSPHGVTLLPGCSGAADLALLDERQRMGLLTAFDDLTMPLDTVLVDTAAGIGSNTLFFAGAAEEICVVVTPEPTSFADAYGAIKALSAQCRVQRIGVVVNMASSPGEARDVFERLTMVTSRFLPIVLEFVGSVPSDPHVHEAVMAQVPVVLEYPTSPASVAIHQLADRLIARPLNGANSGRLQFFWRRLLGMSSEGGVTGDEVRGSA